ncbi:MAG: hypothetical protein HYT94_02800 [Parcubacteria group bacterium]|nr:hypothetical protein [Parcubacteria group bacterium]
MSNKLKIRLIVAAAVILAGGFFVLTQKETVDPVPFSPVVPAPTVTIVDEHLTIDETLRDVNFCGKTYKVKQVLIDGVDVVQRVAELATNDLIPETLKDGPYGPNSDEWKTITMKKEERAEGICKNVSSHTNIGGIVKVQIIGRATNIKTETKTEEGYGILLNESSFTVLLSSHDIYESNEYTGGIFGPIGKLK